MITNSKIWNRPDEGLIFVKQKYIMDQMIRPQEDGEREGVFQIPFPFVSDLLIHYFL